MTQILGGVAGPADTAGTVAFQNTADADRTWLWYSLQRGRSSGVILEGFEPSVVSGQMQLSFTQGAVVCAERDGSGTSLRRGYLVYSDGAVTVPFGAASASARNDAVVAAFVDPEDGAPGTGGLATGGHLVVVPGVSGVTAVRTDTEIRTFLGRGGFLRLYNVPIAAGSTEINLAGADIAAHRNDQWNYLASAVAVSGWSITEKRYRWIAPKLLMLEIEVVNTGSTITVPSDGNIVGDPQIIASMPTEMRPPITQQLNGDRSSISTFRCSITGSGAIHLTHGTPGMTLPNGATLWIRGIVPTN